MIIFDNSTHKYFDGKKELISVTTLLRKHGLSPDYSMVNEEVLKAKAERGTLIHSEIEEWCKKGVTGFSRELELFVKYIKDNNVEILDSEKMVSNDIVAGTCDLLCKRGGKIIRVDFKTTYTVHRDSCSWQLSLYDELDSVKADEFEIWHFIDEEMKIVEIAAKPKEEVSKLLECEKNGELYTQPLLSLDSSALMVIEEAEYAMITAKKLQAKAQEVLAQVKEAMEKNGVTKFENDKLRITYVAPSKKSTVNTKALREKYPQIAEELTETTDVKASIRIKLKEDD